MNDLGFIPDTQDLGFIPDKPSLGSRLVNGLSTAYDRVANVGEQLPRAMAIIPNMAATTLERVSTGKSAGFGQALKSSFQDLYSGNSSNMTQFLQKYGPELTPSDKAVLLNPNFYKSLGTTLAGNAADVMGNLTTPIFGGLGKAVGEVASPLLETAPGQVVKRIASTPIGRRVIPPEVGFIPDKPVAPEIKPVEVIAKPADVGFVPDTPPVAPEAVKVAPGQQVTPAVVSSPQPAKVSPFADSPNLAIGYTEAKKQPGGDWKLFYRGTRNEIFPGEKFQSATEAKSYFQAEKIKAKVSPPAQPSIPPTLEPLGGKVESVNPLANQAGKAQAGLMTGGIDEFLKQDVAGGIAKVSSDLKDVVNGIRVTTTPASMGEFAKATAGNLREQAARMALLNDRTATAFAGAGKVFDRLPPEVNHDVMNKIETGARQSTPQLQGIADGLRTHLDNMRTRVQDLGTGKLQSFYENYFPHIWEDPKKAEGFIGQFYSKKPLEGSKSFLKQRVFPTIQDGINAGLKPISDNPVDLTLLKTREMEKYIMAQKYIAEEKATGRMEFVKLGDKPPDGMTPINDRIGTVYRPGEKGEMILSGHYYAPEQSARIVNNYLSPGVKGSALGKAYEGVRGVGNLLNQAQLGLPAFHAGFTTIDVAVSKLALSFKYLATGDVTGFVKRLAEIPTSVATNFTHGMAFKKVLLGLSPETKEMALLIDGFLAGGDRVSMDKFYASGMASKMGAAFKSGNYPGAILRVPAAVVDVSARPIMEGLVPTQKLGVVSDMIRFELEKLPANATREQVRNVMGKAVDSVDNRMGQLIYDNLHWNKAVKDLSMVGTRSVGWNVGTIREVGGGVFVDTPKFLVNSAKSIANKTKTGEWGVKPEFTHRMAYTVALPIFVGTIGGIMNYLFTGESPKELKDYFFPRTGRLDKNGDPDRVSLPSYMKDVYHYTTNFGKTVSNKLHPLAGVVLDMLSNKDFYGTEIRNQDDPFVQRVIVENAQYLAKQPIPFGIRYAMQPQRQGFLGKVAPFIGVTPAPYDVNQTRLEREASKVSASMAGTAAKTKAQFDKRQTESVIRSRMTYNMTTPPKELYQAVQSGKLTSDDADKIWEERNIPPLVRTAKRLSLEQAISLWKYTTSSNQQERDMFYQIIGDKINNAWDNRSPQEQADLQPRLDKIKAEYWKLKQGGIK